MERERKSLNVAKGQDSRDNDFFLCSCTTTVCVALWGGRARQKNNSPALVRGCLDHPQHRARRYFSGTKLLVRLCTPTLITRWVALPLGFVTIEPRHLRWRVNRSPACRRRQHSITLRSTCMSCIHTTLFGLCCWVVPALTCFFHLLRTSVLLLQRSIAQAITTPAPPTQNTFQSYNPRPSYTTPNGLPASATGGTAKEIEVRHTLYTSTTYTLEPRELSRDGDDLSPLPVNTEHFSSPKCGVQGYFSKHTCISAASPSHPDMHVLPTTNRQSTTTDCVD